ncbi:AraC family transcriptional regulator [Pseudovibrio sp. Tun.PSC04-5.I4]|uniref:AraC family transcriptional regulator n=1 Tax=Pseudovibrio sp. Tun.PSC04-5.I4 TaxID=1798213 RepID=UPI000891F80E|nr:AraC family transcriptional regulator [Pseudovibrio sp. Tun.PSC04-5.I4]SDR37453.1 AraC-type DNA-binding protein [Pseudovibrio sp. Tun.PSC04-5.I4]
MATELAEILPRELRYDRLSALIERFKVEAHVLHNTEEDVLEGNFFILKCVQGYKKLVFLPSTPNNSTLARSLCENMVVLAGAKVVFGGPGSQLGKALPNFVEIYLHEAPDLESLADLVVEEVLSPRCGGSAVINRLCEVVVIRLLRHAVRSGGIGTGLIAGLAHPNIAQALVAIHEGPAQPWRLETLAEVAGMSRTQFAVVFKEVMGETPGSYLSNWRLALAKLDLEAGRPLKSVAARVGFASPTALSRAFQRRYDELPRNVNVKTIVAA